MRNKLQSMLGHVNKELPLILSIVAAGGVLNFFVHGQKLALTFFNLPTLFAAYQFGRRRAVEAALASILFVAWVDIMNPTALGNHAIGLAAVLTWSDFCIWAGFLLVLAYAMGTLYDKADRRLHELRDTYLGVLQILNHMTATDKYTQNHSYRVSVYAAQIAVEMHLSDDRIEDVRAASLLHDIGKLEVSRDILYKAARLNEDEMRQMKTHVDRGIALLSPVGGSLRRVLPIILAHHDKFDGTGYHDTAADDIPLEARIISVADVYDSMISDRPYRKGVSPFEARDVILKGSGSDFDPRVVGAFEAAFNKQRLEVPEFVV
jgi:HD-GYP domain-containing protein (c-di-GMP phosphodiesterase class II)